MGSKVIGGDKALKFLANMVARMGNGGVVKVGFLENADYPSISRRLLASQKKPKKGSKPRKKSALMARKDAKLQEAAAQTGGLKVAQVAFWNEFGTKRAVARPFFRTMVAQKSPQWGTQVAKISKANGYKTQQTLGLMGTLMKDQLVKSIVDFTTPPLRPFTIEQKGFDKPLIDTGVMQRAPDFVVETK